jgi:hypothetical protein
LKRNKWKGVKWIDTRFAKPYKRRLALAHVQAVGVLAMGAMHAKAIQSTNASGRPGAKQAAMAECVLKTHAGIADVYARVRR